MNHSATGALRFGIAAALIFLALGLIGLDDYGLTWDDPENLLTGAHYARFFATWDWDWLDFARYDQLYAAAPSPPLFYNPHFRSAERYPPVANLVSVLTHRLLTGGLGWLGDTDGYHFAVLFFASLAVLVLATFTWQAFGPLAIHLARLHPHQGVYYNPLAGGVQGTAGRYPQEYWGSSFCAGCAWLNEHLPPEAVVLPRVGAHLVRYCARPDLRLIPDEVFPFFSLTQTVYVINMTRVDKYDWAATYVDSHLAPVYQLTVEGVPLLKIVRTDAATLVRGREPTSDALNGPTVQGSENRIQLSAWPVGICPVHTSCT